MLLQCLLVCDTAESLICVPRCRCTWVSGILRVRSLLVGRVFDAAGSPIFMLGFGGFARAVPT